MYQVLIVDDEPFVRQGLKVVIDWEAYGFHIAAEARNGIEAIEYLKRSKFDLIFMDIRMPGMNGLEVSAKIRSSISKRVKIVLLSGYSEFTYAQEALKYNISHYLLKPLDPDQLIKLLMETSHELDKQMKAEQARKDTASIVGAHYLLETLTGRKNEKVARGLEKLFSGQSNFAYLYIELDGQDESFKELSPEEQTENFWELYDYLTSAIGKFKGNILCNVDKKQVFELGIILSDQLVESYLCKEKEDFVEKIKVRTNLAFSYNLKWYLGCNVATISEILTSYLSALDIKASEGGEGDVELLSRIEDEIQKNYRENLSLKELSDKYFINSAYLGQLFKKKYGIYFKDYLNCVRIDKAKELLLNSNEKVYKISELVGYNNVDYFINKFTKVVGTTPSKFRNLSKY